VRVDPEFNFLPKVQSKILDDGSMVSNPIHEMYPPLHPELASSAFRFFTQK
jgi:hypothetical protein